MKTIRLYTESGDKYKIKGDINEIQPDDLEKILREKFPDEWVDENDGPGFRGSYIYIEDEEEYQKI